MASLYSRFVRDIVFPAADLLVGTSLRETYRVGRALEFASRDEIESFQTKKLRSLLKYANENVPYYHNLFSEHGIRDFDEFTLGELPRIPKLTRKIFHANFATLQSMKRARLKYKENQTGGSTGEPLTYLLSLESWSYSWTNNFREWEEIGYEIGDKVFILGSTSILTNYRKSKEQRALHQALRFYAFPGMNMSDEVCAAYVQEIRKIRPKFIYGYASSIFLLAKYILAQKHSIHLKGVMPTSEICPDYYKEAFRTAFHCEVVDSYGARDGNITAHQCRAGNYHIGESSIAQIEGGGKEGVLLVTDLFNYATPFINYELGDCATLSEEICSCGRQQFLFREIIGRKEAVIELANGRRITGIGWAVLLGHRNVRKYRIRQTGPMSLVLDLVPDTTYEKLKEEKIILGSMHKHMGAEVSIQIQYLDDLQVSLSGKATYFYGL